jgi:hypothetical protein
VTCGHQVPSFCSGSVRNETWWTSTENPDSDAAIILSQALEQARSAAPEEQSEILDRALKQAEEARGFSPHLEAPLPDGWPKPSLPGLIRTKSRLFGRPGSGARPAITASS